MSIDTEITSARARHDDPRAPSPSTPSRPGSAGRAVLVSLLTGAFSALILTLVVFPGAEEATLTGALLLAFGFGWALLAVLSERWTGNSQRWAAVPAVAMSATGLALMALRPDDVSMTALNWVWPPVLLAMSVWMFARMRRTSRGKARWLLTPVIAVLALASLAGAYEDLAAPDALDSYPVPGRLYDVGGHRLHLDCRGHGTPTVVLFNGLGESSAGWARITGPVAETARVCAYDRPGQGWSDEAGTPWDGVASAAALHALLREAGERGPYVLVGHSVGGPYAMTYAARYPEQVAGLVLLDSSSPEQFTRMPAYPGQYQMMRRAVALMPTLHRLGLGRLLTPRSHLPAADADVAQALSATTGAARNARDELSVIRTVFTQAQELTSLVDRPLAVLTASENSRTDGWLGAQQQLAALSGNHLHRTIASTHTGLLEDARPAAASVLAISEVISSARTGDRLLGK